MPTSLKTVTERALTYIKNDRSLESDLDKRLPVFYNRLNEYLRTARTLVNRPPEVLARTAIAVPPMFARIEGTVDEDMPPSSVLDGAAGYTLFSACRIVTDQYGYTDIEPLKSTGYDAETGQVTVGETLHAGDRLELCFYDDGYFATELNESEINLLAYAMYYIWEKRNSNDALERKTKLRDSSFSTISEAAQTDANTTRLEQAKLELEGMLRRYEEEMEYNRTVKERDRYGF